MVDCPNHIIKLEELPREIKNDIIGKRHVIVDS